MEAEIFEIVKSHVCVHVQIVKTNILQIQEGPTCTDSENKETFTIDSTIYKDSSTIPLQWYDTRVDAQEEI